MTKQEVSTCIAEEEKRYATVLNQTCTNVIINVPVTLAQIEATFQVTTLYRVLDEERPRFRCGNE